MYNIYICVCVSTACVYVGGDAHGWGRSSATVRALFLVLCLMAACVVVGGGGRAPLCHTHYCPPAPRIRSETRTRIFTSHPTTPPNTTNAQHKTGFGAMTPVDNLYPNNWRVPMMTLDEFSRTIAKVRATTSRLVDGVDGCA